MALTTGGMSFPLISCNRTGVITGGVGVGGVADADKNTRRFPVHWTCDTSEARVTLSGYSALARPGLRNVASVSWGGNFDFN